MGEWLRANGESIYGTRGGPVKPRPWGVTTQKGDKIYVHVLDWSDEVLALPKMPNIAKATLLASGKPVQISNAAGATLLRFPTADRDPIDTIVVLERGR
jgi:alpha-L-fucosidase